MRGKVGSGWLGRVGQRAKVESRGREGEQRQRKRKESRAEQSRAYACFGRKMVYGKFFRKPFSKILLRIFRSNYKHFCLTCILQRNKHQQMMKIFYVETNGVLNFGAKIIYFSFI